MINPADRKSALLADSFHEDWAQGVPHGFARQAAAAARLRRSRRAAAAAVSALAAAVALMRVRSPQTAGPAAPLHPPAYTVITDAELLAELRDRPLFVIGSPSAARQFVVLGP